MDKFIYIWNLLMYLMLLFTFQGEVHSYFFNNQSLSMTVMISTLPPISAFLPLCCQWQEPFTFIISRGPFLFLASLMWPICHPSPFPPCEYDCIILNIIPIFDFVALILTHLSCNRKIQTLSCTEFKCYHVTQPHPICNENISEIKLIVTVEKTTKVVLSSVL